MKQNTHSPRWESNLGRMIYRQTLYHVAAEPGGVLYTLTYYIIMILSFNKPVEAAILNID